MRETRKAKIVATLGPASSDRETIRKLFEAGAGIFRLNFSHGTHQDHAETHKIIRELERDTGRPIAILQDLQGPKMRIGKVEDGCVQVHAGTTLRFVLDDDRGVAETIPLPHPEIFAAVMPGQKLLLDDGKLRFDVVRISDEEIEARVVVGGPLSNHKGVNVPDTILDLSPLTEKDRADLAFGKELGMDFVALSFVQRPADVLEGRQLIGEGVGLMTKIEKPAALDRMDDIVALSDAVMVARGDLGVETPPEDVPGIQKDLIHACRVAGKPVIVATHMLDSMTNVPTPTRAEASDVANAIYDGADAVMLSAESAAGRYPVEAVSMMSRIISRTEQHKTYRSIIDALEPELDESAQHAVSAAAAVVAEKIDAKAIVAFTSSGTTAVRIARERSEVPIIGVTPKQMVARQLALLWGTYSIRSADIETYDEMVAEALKHAREDGFAAPNDQIVVVAGVPFGVRGTTNNLRVATA